MAFRRLDTSPRDEAPHHKSIADVIAPNTHLCSTEDHTDGSITIPSRVESAQFPCLGTKHDAPPVLQPIPLPIAGGRVHRFEAKIWRDVLRRLESRPAICVDTPDSVLSRTTDRMCILRRDSTIRLLLSRDLGSRPRWMDVQRRRRSLEGRFAPPFLLAWKFGLYASYVASTHPTNPQIFLLSQTFSYPLRRPLRILLQTGRAYDSRITTLPISDDQLFAPYHAHAQHGHLPLPLLRPCPPARRQRPLPRLRRGVAL